MQLVSFAVDWAIVLKEEPAGFKFTQLPADFWGNCIQIKGIRFIIIEHID